MLKIVYAPNAIFKQKAIAIEKVDQGVRDLADKMLEAMYRERAVGLGANMVGVLKSIAVVDLMENGVKKPYVFINPAITVIGSETQSFLEASLSFPGIEALITRPKHIEVKYFGLDGEHRVEQFSDFLATVIQHEVDYLNGKVFLDHLSSLKQSMLLKKMHKFMRLDKGHVHGEHCSH